MVPFVPAVVPNILQALVLVIVFSLVLAPYMRKHAGAFYLGFLAFSIASFLPAMDANPAFKTVVDLFASCYTGVAFYLVVMFIGALPKRWQAVRRLLAARSELSVIGGIVICAHGDRRAAARLLSRALDHVVQSRTEEDEACNLEEGAEARLSVHGAACRAGYPARGGACGLRWNRCLGISHVCGDIGDVRGHGHRVSRAEAPYALLVESCERLKNFSNSRLTLTLRQGVYLFLQERTGGCAWAIRSRK